MISATLKGDRRPRLDNGVDRPDWSNIPMPADDGKANHLPGLSLPPIALPATNGQNIDLSACRGRTVIYAYPRTGRPGVPNPDGWDMIPGARGCSPQSCAFRDHFADLKQRGVSQLYGLSTQDTAYQLEVASRLHLPFPLLSDEKLAWADAVGLPTFRISGMTLLKRCTLVVDDGRISHCFYPVFPPDQHVGVLVAWLAGAAREEHAFHEPTLPF